MSDPLQMQRLRLLTFTKLDFHMLTEEAQICFDGKEQENPRDDDKTYIWQNL